MHTVVFVFLLLLAVFFYRPTQQPALTTEMAAYRGEGFFEALFGFREGSYLPTRQQLFHKCTFEAQESVTSTGAQRVRKERAVFYHPGPANTKGTSANASGSASCGHRISSGWHSTPSVAELRAETAELVQRFEEQRPGLLSKLRGTQYSSSLPGPNLSAEASGATGGSAPWVRCSHTTGESGALHRRFPGALFQVASQFNLLEFISSDVTPEAGVTHYVYDRTQGPACALACMAGTAYRNYLLHPDLFGEDASRTKPSSVVGEAQRGQQATHQLNMLSDVTTYLTQAHGSGFAPTAAKELPLDHFYKIHNGYYFPSAAMAQFTSRLREVAAAEQTDVAAVEEALLSRLRIGVVEEATVTLPLHGTRHPKAAPPAACDLHEVSQTYNSALSLPSSTQSSAASWAGMELLARIILRGTYEATLLAGVQHTLRALQQQQQEVEGATPAQTVPPIFLTKVGGGVFHNDAEWIAAAIESAVRRVAPLGVPLDVRLVHFRAVEPDYMEYFPSWPVLDSA